MKKVIVTLFLIISLGAFFVLILASSPYRELRPYELFGRKIPEKKGLSVKTVNERTAVLIGGKSEDGNFYMDQIPVTVGAYKRCIASGSCQTHHYRDSYTKYYTNDLYDIFPMSFATFEEARTYCQTYGGDLPTASQWRLAAGSGDYAWGDQDPSLSRANLDGFYQWQTPAGWLPKGASADGLLDMTGNVREWILDNNPDNEPERGLKGGAFQDDFGAGESDFTFYHEPTSSGFNRGFRCVYPAEP